MLIRKYWQLNSIFIIALLGLLVMFATAPAQSTHAAAQKTDKAQNRNKPEHAGNTEHVKTNSSPATLVFMTDFGVIDDSVALCKGVMLGIAPELRIIDLTHQVTPYSILDGARFLAGTTPYYRAGTVFVVVIDPGVGSTRRAIVVKSKRDQYFVLPDNGLMTLVQDQDGIVAAREIKNTDWMLDSAVSSTFHGRDIFSPVGAHLARGDDWTQVGPLMLVNDLVRLNITAAKLDRTGIYGDIIALDGPYGNLVTNIDGREFLKLNYNLGDRVSLKINDKEVVVPFVKTFSDVALNAPLLYIDSRGHIALAINQGNFAQTYGITPPMHITISVKPRKKTIGVSVKDNAQKKLERIPGF